MLEFDIVWDATFSVSLSAGKSSSTTTTVPIPISSRKRESKLGVSSNPSHKKAQCAKDASSFWLSHPDIPRNRKKVANQHILNCVIANLLNPFSLNNRQRTQTYSMRHQSLGWHIMLYCVEHQRIPKTLVFTR